VTVAVNDEEEEIKWNEQKFLNFIFMMLLSQ
jgi:hypothetical protein